MGGRRGGMDGWDILGWWCYRVEDIGFDVGGAIDVSGEECGLVMPF